MPTTKYSLLPGETLSVATDATASCVSTQVSAAGTIGSLLAPVSVPANSSITIGPRNDASAWQVDTSYLTGVTVTRNAAAPAYHLNQPSDVGILYGAGAPSASVGANHANTGSLYVDTSAGELYVNSGTKSSMSWRLVTSA
jgi:hypothetical protein